jgi:hypothetical protein
VAAHIVHSERRLIKGRCSMAARMEEYPLEDLPEDDDEDDDDKQHRRAPAWVFPPVGAAPTGVAHHSYEEARV